MPLDLDAIPRKMTCGVRFKGGFQEFGVEEVNEAIRQGGRVTKIETSILCDKVPATSTGVIRLAYTGCEMVVTFEG